MPLCCGEFGRLPTVLPEWTRVAWVSQAARQVWEPRLAQITAAWLAIERWAVVDGVRASALQTATPEELPALTTWAAEHGLGVVTLSREAAAQTYRASGKPATAGEPWQYRVAITRPESQAAWPRAWAQQDNDRIGILLGFPACCRAFFQRVWIDGQHVDTTWHMALATKDHAERRDRTVVVRRGLDRANILLRWIGVRAVPHLPCSFECLDSDVLGDELIGVGRAHGYEAEVGWIEEMLRWPVEWSALHGIAEIKTPILKVSTRTDMTKGKLVVQRHGAAYPAEGATGVTFPFQPPGIIPITSIMARKGAYQTTHATEAHTVQENPYPYCPTQPSEIVHHDHGGPCREAIGLGERLWTDNGFHSREAMEHAHAVVCAAVSAKPERVLDLGCGNGRLAREIAGDGKAYGVEIDRFRAAQAWRHLDSVKVCDIRDTHMWGGVEVDLVVLMPGRLIEMTPETRQRVLDQIGHLRAKGARVLAYAYGDWLERYGTLMALCREAGLGDLVRNLRTGEGVEAGLVEWAS